jgi:acetyltransferase-like isoleucine patch superfamily enzyme
MMKNRLKAILVRSGLLRIWNRHLGGNRTRVFGAGNQIHIGRSLLTQTRIRIEGRHNLVTIGDGCRLRDLKIIVVGENLRVSIAEHCQLRGKIKVEDTGSQISVGAGTTMENGYLGAYEGTSITVGNDCMFSDQVGLRTGDMHSILDAETQTRLNPAQSITIESQVWLCRGVTVLKGCTIGTRTVVGGYSIVTSSLPPGVLAVGTPAKVIRDHITWSRERVATDR